ncbi:Uncharacterized [Syntrophomonas zehnderi OL-4]|uniref:Uncharacterized n=1 Tax=Syntrophomonas zehnderi OL-4 TaxID=690567 RepID=A0A0E4G9W6_9FIRM|nr:hypothetical protein [Syntrophomonas zehnderi]CFX15318.1 Uncharacterized [Syntrophomonas zehnderi OL-4]
MWKKAKRLLSNQKGNTFLENGLWIVLIVFALAVAGGALALVVSGKYSALADSIKAISIPTI